MAVNGDIYLGPSGAEILVSPFGRSLRIIPKEFGRADSTLVGAYKKDIVGIKYTFEMPFSLIDGDALTTLLNLYDGEAEYSLLIYLSDSETLLNYAGSTPTVIIEPIQRRRLLLAGSGLWEEVNLTLEEV